MKFQKKAEQKIKTKMYTSKKFSSRGGLNMKLFDRLKPKRNKDFFEWLDAILKNELSGDIKAINFNLYEDAGNKWAIELVGTASFDKDDDDWACDEVFTTRDDPFVVKSKNDWESMEEFFIGLVNEYLSAGKYIKQ